MIKRLLRCLGTLLALQIVFSGIIFMLADLRWLSIPLGLAFVGLVGWTGWGFGLERGSQRSWQVGAGAVLVGLTWQIPGLQGTYRFLSDTFGWTAYNGITDLQDFAMESWHTVLMPLLSTLPPGLVWDYYARYYIALLALSPLLVLVFWASALAGKFNNPREKRFSRY